jgi:hypothetical protein
MSMTKIAEIVVGSGGISSIDFNSIPQTYTDLLLVVSARGTSPSDTDNGGLLKINGSSSGYTSRDFYGSGSSAASSTNPYSVTSAAFIGATPGGGATASTFGNKSIYIPNYAGSTVKTISVDSVMENNGTLAYQECIATYWSGTAAVTSLSLTLTYLNYAQYSIATLYGISKVPSAGIQPKATGGDIYQNGTYTYHVFRSSGTFTPATALTNSELLIIGGGGNGGGGTGQANGGGGAGGVVYSGVQQLSTSPLTVTVGAGGGNSSSVTGFTTALGGGRGQYYDPYSGNLSPSGGGQSGASGGGGNGRTGGSYPGGTGTAGQGYDGGSGGFSSNGYFIGGGGGGAAGAGGRSDGGLATSAYSAWSYATSTGVSGAYAGGGSGAHDSSASGGSSSGGGGAGGGAGNTGANGVANTGSGGGGSSGSFMEYAGGSGVVIIRYS